MGRNRSALCEVNQQEAKMADDQAKKPDLKVVPNKDPSAIFDDLAALQKASKLTVKRKTILVNVPVDKPPNNVHFRTHTTLKLENATVIKDKDGTRDVYYFIVPDMRGHPKLAPRLRPVTIMLTCTWPGNGFLLWPVPEKEDFKAWKSEQKSSGQSPKLLDPARVGTGEGRFQCRDRGEDQHRASLAEGELRRATQDRLCGPHRGQRGPLLCPQAPRHHRLKAIGVSVSDRSGTSILSFARTPTTSRCRCACTHARSTLARPLTVARRAPAPDPRPVRHRRQQRDGGVEQQC